MAFVVSNFNLKLFFSCISPCFAMSSVILLAPLLLLLTLHITWHVNTLYYLAAHPSVTVMQDRIAVYHLFLATLVMHEHILSSSSLESKLLKSLGGLCFWFVVDKNLEHCS